MHSGDNEKKRDGAREKIRSRNSSYSKIGPSSGWYRTWSDLRISSASMKARGIGRNSVDRWRIWGVGTAHFDPRVSGPLRRLCNRAISRDRAIRSRGGLTKINYSLVASRREMKLAGKQEISVNKTKITARGGEDCDEETQRDHAWWERALTRAGFRSMIQRRRSLRCGDVISEA